LLTQRPKAARQPAAAERSRKERKMKKLMSGMAVLAAAVLVAACGSVGPTAVSPTPVGDEGVANAQFVAGGITRIDPAKCGGVLEIGELGAGEGWVKLEAAFKDEKGFAYPCGAVEFSITPSADLRNPRFNTNQVIVSGEPGLYYLTASAGGDSASVKLFIK
jgi:hypothetical protein